MPNIDSTPIHVGADLEFAGNHVRVVAGELVDELNGLRTSLEPLIATWRAQSSDLYQALMNEWDASARGLFGSDGDGSAGGGGGVLGDIAHVLDTNWINYMGAEEANRRTFMH